MYEDSQRFSEGEEEEDSRVITINPHLLVDARDGRSMHRQDDIEPVDSTAFTMQRVVDRDTRSPLTGGDDTVEHSRIYKHKRGINAKNFEADSRQMGEEAFLQNHE